MPCNQGRLIRTHRSAGAPPLVGPPVYVLNGSGVPSAFFGTEIHTNGWPSLAGFDFVSTDCMIVMVGGIGSSRVMPSLPSGFTSAATWSLGPDGGAGNGPHGRIAWAPWGTALGSFGDARFMGLWILRGVDLANPIGAISVNTAAAAATSISLSAQSTQASGNNRLLTMHVQANVQPVALPTGSNPASFTQRADTSNVAGMRGRIGDSNGTFTGATMGAWSAALDTSSQSIAAVMEIRGLPQ